MSNKACKVKVCVCGAVFKGENLGKNFEAFDQVRAVLNPSEHQLTAAGVDEVIALADKANAILQDLNDALIKVGVNLSS